MELLIIIGFCIVSAVICKITEKENKEIKVLIVLAAVCVVFMKCLECISGISSQIQSLFEMADIDDEYIKILFKGLGICCITQLACDFCRDCGENAVAGQAELAGKIALLIISLPLFSAITDIVKTLLV